MDPSISPLVAANEVESPSNPSQLDSYKLVSEKEEVYNAPQIPHGVVRYWILCCIGFCFGAPILSILLGFYLHTKDLNYTPFNPLLPSRTVSLVALLVSADPTSSTITFDWAVESDTGCGTNDNEPCLDVNIFFDEQVIRLLADNIADNYGRNLLTSSDSSDPDSINSSDPPSKPLFRLNATSFASEDIRANSATFRTDIRLFQSGRPRRSALVNYPFDTYATSIFMFATDTNNDTVTLQLLAAERNAVGFKTTFFQNTEDPDVILINISVERGGLIIAFCVIITISIWLITLVLFLLAFTSIVFGFRQRTEVLIIPVATVFAFTQLRGSMPGAPPGFGDVLDFVGLLPCLAILSFSAALTLGALIFTDPTKKAELTWEMIKPEILPVLGIKRKGIERASKGHYSGA